VRWIERQEAEGMITEEEAAVAGLVTVWPVTSRRG
jgi:hypothetical protein